MSLTVHIPINRITCQPTGVFDLFRFQLFAKLAPVFSASAYILYGSAKLHSEVSRFYLFKLVIWDGSMVIYYQLYFFILLKVFANSALKVNHIFSLKFALTVLI